MKICLTGDVFLGGDLLNKSVEGVIRSSFFRDADFRVVNLEQPISDSDYVEDKCTLLSSSFATTQLKEMGVGAVNLAHNHIQDAGINGIDETICHLRLAGIESFGAGKNIFRAEKPFWIDENLAILGYCEYGKPYLSQIKVADAKSAGVNPLRHEKIVRDLDALPEGKKAILYFHWGREHVWLPPSADLDLARRLLNDDRVALIVGMHAHRAQGYIEHNGKRAYMCLGNFLFPNFFMAPPAQIFYPVSSPKFFNITRQYHSVYKITYKKWRLLNRVSMLLDFDSATGSVNHHFVIQNDERAEVDDLGAFWKGVMGAFISLLSAIYKMNPSIYIPLERGSSFFAIKIWRVQVYLFKMRQLGIACAARKFISKIKSVKSK